MSEYLSKKAVLGWLDENIKDQDWPHEMRYAFKHVRKKILSGAFDADESEGTWKATSEFAFRLNDQLEAENQRLRVAAIKLHETLNTYWQGDCEKADVVAAQSNLCDVLDSIGNHPKQIKPFQQRLLELTIEENKKIYNTPKGDGNDA